jgi:hypothetical protein
VVKSHCERLYKKWNMQEPEQEARRGSPAKEKRRKRLGLTGLKERLRHHLRYCANHPFASDSDRNDAWQGAFKHYEEPGEDQAGREWKLRDQPWARECLQGFLSEMAHFSTA